MDFLLYLQMQNARNSSYFIIFFKRLVPKVELEVLMFQFLKKLFNSANFILLSNYKMIFSLNPKRQLDPYFLSQLSQIQ